MTNDQNQKNSTHESGRAPDHGDAAAERTAILERAGIIDRDPLTRFFLRGKHARDLLQRLSTNDVKKAPAGSVVGTIFTNEKGRMLEVAELWLGDREDLLLGASGDRAGFTAWIDRMTFREDVTLEDRAGTDACVTVLGPAALEVVKSALPEAAALLEGHHGRFTRGGHEVAIARRRLYGLDAFHFSLPRAAWPEVSLALREAGARPAGAIAEEWVRVASGEGAWGHEWTPEHNPHEAGLGPLIDWNKGCYIGQEVIARLDTYKKVQRALVRLRLSRAVAANTALALDGASVGVITSVAECPGAPFVAALAYVKAAHAEAPAFTVVGHADVSARR